MSYPKKAGFAALGGLLCCVAVFFWLHHRIEQTRAEVPHPSANGSNMVASNNSAKDFGSRAPNDVIADAKTPAAREVPGPLRAGEVLEYTANVSKLNNVANLRVQVAERRSFLGKSAWHFQGFAHTENPLRTVFPLDDQFDSYSDVKTFVSMQYEMRLDERGQKVQSLQRMVPDSGQPAPSDATLAVVPAGTRDPLGMLVYLRNIDWAKSPEVRSSVYDGQKLYEVRASLASNLEKVKVPAGSYTVSKIELRVFDHGTEMKDSHFFLYLTNDAARTPALLEAQLPFANARVELLRAQ